MLLRSAILSLSIGLAAFAAANSPTFVEGTVLVKFRPGYTVASRAANLSIGASESNFWPQIGVSKLTIPANMTVSQAVGFYRSKSFVQFVEPDYVHQIQFTPNDPLFGTQYQHTQVKTPQAWDLDQGAAWVKIAILDTGVDLTHPDLAMKVGPGFDFINNDADPSDDHGHGTHVAGLAAAATNNGIGTAGTGFNCRIMPVKVATAFGGIPTSASVSGMTFAADNGAKVINMSYGGSGASASEQAAVNYAWGKGVVLVAASGNSGVSTIFYPAGFAKVIAVGATNQNDQKAGFSNFGPWVDVAAPGVDTPSTLLGGGYGGNTGTSMSSPVAAGVVGLVWSIAGQSATPAEIRGYVESTCDNVGNWVFFGRVNAFAALNTVPIFIISPIGAVSPVVTEGLHTAGAAASLHNVDGDLFSMETIAVRGLGTVATMNASYDVDAAVGEIDRLTARANLSGSQGSTAFLYIYNWSTGKYLHVKSKPVGPNTIPTDFEVIFKKPYASFIHSDGTVKIAVRVVGPRRNPITFQSHIDRLELLVRTRIPR